MPANAMTILTWVLRIVVAAAFLVPAYFKLSGMPMMVDEFNSIAGSGGDAFRYFTGLVEVVGALAVLYPGTTPWGCLLLLCVLVGAFVANAFILQHDFIHVLVYAVVVLALFWLTRRPVMSAIGSRA